ncbi:PAS domain-containing sensor histidine kinase [Hymenobacter sp.]|jgi:two-component system sensor histidine kinase VicK|uniref:PAS domain-containing sensor histidine kinase n=1 Tax=Hymenobacter sp. TaxID=1898978 RepID=UPI002EDAA40F
MSPGPSPIADDLSHGVETPSYAQQCEQSQRRFHTVFEQSPLGQKIIGPDLLILQVNQALLAMLGYTQPADLVGRRILDFAHPDHRADWALLQERLWARKAPNFTLETCMLRQDGSSFWCQVVSSLFEDQGRTLGYTTLIDIDERKQLEASLKRVYDAQETILHLVAHDLKTPIANIQLLTHLLRLALPADERTPAEKEVEREQHLALIDQSCAEAADLLKDVLYLGELDASILKKEPTDLNKYLRKRLTIFHLAAQQKGLTLVLDLPPHVVQARLHRQRFGRVLDNLLSNALKFTPAPGRITVRLQEHMGRARLSVQDTGVGIPAALQEQIFDKFSSAARTGQYSETTTGLGLFITRQIVQLHGGKIWLESVEHEGSTFFIELR